MALNESNRALEQIARAESGAPDLAPRRMGAHDASPHTLLAKGYSRFRNGTDAIRFDVATDIQIAESERAGRLGASWEA